MEKEGMNWTLGKAEKKDSDRINELFVEMLQTIYHTDQVNGYSEGDLDRFFDNRDEWISVAIDADRIIAFLSIEVHHEEREYLYLDDLSVTEQYRNHGIGTRLIQNAEAYAKDIHICTICFHVEKSNTEAFKLYRRLGYEIHEDQGNRYLMIKHLS